jgi:hypothetical protein
LRSIESDGSKYFAKPSCPVVRAYTVPGLATKSAAIGDSGDSAGVNSPAAFAHQFCGGENVEVISEGVFGLTHGRAAAGVCTKKNTTPSKI